MKRKIIHIDESRCDGCGACAAACHEGAIAMVEGKARLIRDDYCDGLGDCLPACHAGAIHIIEREAAPYDEAAVRALQSNRSTAFASTISCACPGQKARTLARGELSDASAENAAINRQSRLVNWPVQIRLAPIQAPYFAGARLLIAADCAAYAHADFHERFMANRVTLIGCPKLDPVDYTDKLTAILMNNDIESVTVIRMEVPCCGGLERAVCNAIQASGKAIHCHIVTLGIDGQIKRKH